MLPPSLREKISALFGISAYTEYDFARTSEDDLSLPTFQREISTYNKCRDYALAAAEPKPAVEALGSGGAPLPTSLDFVFGGALRRGEVTSIEGCSGVGKTRICFKIAHEVSQSGRVLFVDADFTLQNENIRDKIADTLGLENRAKIVFGIDEIASFNVVGCNDLLDVYNVVNEYLRKCEEGTHGYPDLIVVDSLMPLFQSNTNKKGPGSAMLQEFAIEIKNIAHKYDCVVLVTNALRREKGNYSTFLGRLYESLWHQRLQIFSKNFITSKCVLVTSPRYREQTKFISILRLNECDEFISDLDEI